MKRNRVDTRIANLAHALDWQTAMVEVTDTIDNAVVIAEQYLPNATPADIIKIAQMLLQQSKEYNEIMIKKSLD